jgi:hypothetical protein
MSAARTSAAPAETAALPATAVAENRAVEDRPAVAAADDHTPTAAGPAVVYSAQGVNDSVAETAQRNETIVSPDETALRQDGIVTPGESEVTARNASGVEAVQDGTQRDVYTGMDGSGGTSATIAGRDSEEVMTQ